MVYLFLAAHREHAIPRQSQMLSSNLLQQNFSSGSILLTGSRVSNEPIMNPGGQKGSKSSVNLMRIGKWTVGSEITSPNFALNPGSRVPDLIFSDKFQEMLNVYVRVSTFKLLPKYAKPQNYVTELAPLMSEPYFWNCLMQNH